MKPFPFILLAVVVTIPSTLLAEKPRYNYGEALQKAIYFYECQRAGKLLPSNRVAWRGDSALEDGADNKVNLVGGWYDAGDHVKFGFPMAGSATLLAWGAIDYRDAYKKAGQLESLLDNLRWVSDYFLKAHTGPTELYGQVGSGNADHAWWGPAEVMPMKRPSFKINADKPGSDLAGETAAALAAASIVFRESDKVFADKLLKSARQLYTFAEKHRGKYSDAIPDARSFYQSFGGYQDELTWAATWLYRATEEKEYLEAAEGHYLKMNAQPGAKSRSYKWTHSWDDKAYGCYVLLAKLTGKEIYHEDARRWLDYWTVGYKGERIHYTPGGLAWLDRWGSLRYSANTAFLALLYSDSLKDEDLKKRYRTFAIRQIDYMLGDNPSKRSYVVGYGENPPLNPHHRTAHGSWANDLQTPKKNRHILYGALVGGPGRDDVYKDDRGDFVCNEVACDYNAAFTGALAWLVKEFGGEALKEFPPKETRDAEFYVEAAVNAAGKNFTEIRAVLHNRSAWPARSSKALAFRYQVDLSEVVKAGFKIEDVKLSLNYHQGVKAPKLITVNEKKHLYYVELSFEGTVIFPGGQSESRKEVQFRLALPNTAPETAWVPGNDWSYQGLANARQLTTTPFLPIYEGGRLVSGTEPASDKK